MSRQPSNSRRTRARRARPGAAGFTLLEMLLAATLTIVMLGLAFMLTGQLLNISAEATSTSEMNQNLRAAADLISQDLTMAASGIPIGGLPLPSGANSNPVLRPGPSGADFPASYGVIPAVTPGYGLGPNQTFGDADTEYQNGAETNSDELTILAVDPLSTINECSNPAPIHSCPLTSVSATQATFDATTNMGTGPEAISAGDLLMFENSNGAAVAMVTAVSGHVVTMAAGDPLGLNQPTAAAGSLASIVGGSPPTTAYRLEMISYYLNFANPALPALMRQYNDQAPMKVADGITGLQFTYDLSDGVTIDQRTVTQPNQIRKVNFVISARSQNKSQKTQQYYTDTLATAVMIRNLEYRNRY